MTFLLSSYTRLKMLRQQLAPVLAVLLFCRCLSAQTKPKFVAIDELPMSAADVAKTAGLQPLFERLARQAGSLKTVEGLLLRQQFLEEVTSASLQVDATAGQIDAEIAEISELENYLSGKRERQINLLNLASLAAGGSLGTASASLGLVGEGRASSIAGILAGSVTTTLSVIGLRQRRGASQALQVPSNMLANLFERPSVSNNMYPSVIRAFMNSIAPNEKAGLSRKERLIRSWIEVGRIPDPMGEKGKEKIMRLTSLPSEERKLSINDLNDRQAMLHDFRAKLLYIKRDLALLLASLPKAPLVP